MSDNNEFAERFVQLLNDSKFPSGLGATEILRQTHAINYALITKVLSQLGTNLTFLDIASQGPKGGGPPHRLDEVVHYLTGVDGATMENSVRINKGVHY
jgi:hypothetical protein